MTGGVYRIVNSINGKCYVGSSNNLLRRNRDHFNALKGNRNKSIHLQRAYNKHGCNSFEFEILARCPEEYLLKLEQWFMDKLKPEYNIYKVALSNKRGKPHSEYQMTLYKKRVYSEEARRRISEANKNKKLSEAHKASLLKAITGRRISKEQRQKLSDLWKGHKWDKERNLKVSIGHLGSKNYITKLTESQVYLIKRNIHKGIKREITLKEFSITNAIYDNIKTGKTWNHVKFIPDTPKYVKPVKVYTGNVSLEIRNRISAGKKGKTRVGKPRKLTPEKVIEIKKLLHDGNLSMYKIKDIYNVNGATIRSIKNETTWKHVKLESVR